MLFPGWIAPSPVLRSPRLVALSSIVVGVTVLLMAAYSGDIPYYWVKIRAAEQRGIGKAG